MSHGTSPPARPDAVREELAELKEEVVPLPEVVEPQHAAAKELKVSDYSACSIGLRAFPVGGFASTVCGSAAP